MRNKGSDDDSDNSSCWQKNERSTPIVDSLVALTMTAMSILTLFWVVAGHVDRLYNKQLNTSQMPKFHMKAFIEKEKAYGINVTDVTGLPADLFKIYSAASCLEGNSIEKLRENLRIQLDNVPENVRDRLVNRALMEGISQKSSITDSDSRVGKDGQATMFMAYWSTTYNGDELVVIGGSKYSTCIIVTGVNLTLTKTIIYEESEHQKVVGSEPCDRNCGRSNCQQCAVYDTTVTKKPIFKNSLMSIDQQDRLYSWMVKRAAESVELSVGI